ncbi:MAG: replication protein [Pseudobdellovibrio sp.]
MASVNDFLQAALEKQKLRDEKNEVKISKKIVKGVRPYNYVNEPASEVVSEPKIVLEEVVNPVITEIVQAESAPIKIEPISLISKTAEIEEIKIEPNPINVTAKIAKHEVSAEQAFKAQPVVIESNIDVAAIHKNRKVTNPIESKEPNDDQIKYATDEYEEKYSNAAKNLAKGFTRTPNEILFKIMSGDVEPREIRVLLAILRLSNGFGKMWVSVSANYLVDLTKIPSNHIFKCIKGLIEKGLIEKKVTSENGRSSSNQYRVLFDGKNSFLDYTQEETGFIQKIETYLSSILVKAQREIEKKSVRELIDSGISQEEIHEAISIIRERGMPGTNSIPNNPAAYLSKAGSRIFDDLRKRNNKNSQSYQSSQQAVSEQISESEKINSEALAKFNSAYSNIEIRKTVLSELVSKYKTLKNINTDLSAFLPESVVIQCWASGEIVV